jgi:hypothetical protein
VLRFIKDRPAEFVAYLAAYFAAVTAALSSILPWLDLAVQSWWSWSPWCLYGRLWGIANMALAIASIYVVSVHLLFYKLCLNYRTIVIQMWMEPALQFAQIAVPLLALLMAAFDGYLMSSSTVCDSTAAELTVRYLCCETKYGWFAEGSFVAYSRAGLVGSSLAGLCIYHIMDTDVKRTFAGAYKETCPDGCEWKPDEDTYKMAM